MPDQSDTTATSPSARSTTCGDCIMLAECSYEFGAHPDDRVCTGFREPLRVRATGGDDGTV